MRQSWKKRQFILKLKFSLQSPLSMLKVPSFNRCVGFVLSMSKKWQRNLHSLFTKKDLSRSLLASQVDASSENLPNADVDDNEDCDEGFEDEDYDWSLCLISWQLSRTRSTFSFRYRVYKITHCQREMFDHCPQVIITFSRFCFQEVIYKREVKVARSYIKLESSETYLLKLGKNLSWDF